MATDIERLIGEVQRLSPDERRRLREAMDEQVARSSASPLPTDEEYQERLVEAGLLKQVRPRRRDQRAFDSYRPVEISGKPLSETIIEERR